MGEQQSWWQRRSKVERGLLITLGVLIAAYILLVVGSLFIGTKAYASSPKACAALSPTALKKLHPGTPCAKRAAQVYRRAQTGDLTALQIQQMAYCEAVPGGCPSLGIMSGSSEGAPSPGAISSGPNAGAFCKYGLKNKGNLTAYFQTTVNYRSTHDWCIRNGRIVTRNSSHILDITNWGHFLLRYAYTDAWGHNYCVKANVGDTYPTSCVYRFRAEVACCLGKPLTFVTKRCAATRICAYVCGPNGAYHSRQIIYGSCPS